MLKRKIETVLTEWKNTKGHSPLIIKGQRQCGKTFSVRDFAEKNYKHTVYLNFVKNPNYIAIFNGSLEVDNLIIMMTAVLGNDIKFIP
ncbi:MAG: AAA family ATPase, partial [Ruminococcus flavefaciens]|nr:AAA family ATPase [Ruminococcus flavefaciens]